MVNLTHQTVIKFYKFTLHKHNRRSFGSVPLLLGMVKRIAVRNLARVYGSIAEIS